MLLLAGGTAIHFDNVGSEECGPGQQVRSASSPPPGPNNTLSFGELTPTQRAAFRDALTCTAQFAPESKWLNLSRGYAHSIGDPFRENEYVRYEGDRYEIVFTRGEFFASYGISTSVATPPAGASVTAFEEFPKRIRDEMKTALTTGQYSSPAGKWETVPEPLDGGEYVRYENQTYEVSVVVADGRVDVMTLERED